MGDLGKESCNFSLCGVQVTSVSKLGEASGGFDKGGIRIEPFGWAGIIIFMQEHLVVELL